MNLQTEKDFNDYMIDWIGYRDIEYLMLDKDNMIILPEDYFKILDEAFE